jgi:Spy/CpxP family protein refolding chaperone
MARQNFLPSWIVIAVFSLLVPLLLHVAAVAQPMRISPEERTAQLKKELSLTEEQAAKVRTILDEAQKESQKLFESSRGDRAAMREMMMKKAEETDEKISALLNQEQKVKFAELQKQRRARFEQRQRDRDTR